MLESVEIRNWQSLRRVELPLGRFTVIVGASSSGKTALMRALRAVASNVRGNSAITRGADAAAITVRLGNGETVTLEYVKGSWQYRLVDTDGAERIYTKLNGQVPHAVTAALRMAPVPVGGTAINFAGQFDPPYLLAQSGSVVARELGELTNAHTLFEAARAGIRRRNSHAATLRTREADLAAVTERVAAFVGLPRQLAACERAEVAAEAAARLRERITRLRDAVDALTVVETAVTHTLAVPAPPDDQLLLHAYERRAGLHARLKEWAGAAMEQRTAREHTDTLTTRITELDTELHATLVQAGTCPTCNQPIPDR